MLAHRKIDYVNEQITNKNVYDIAKIAALIATKNYIKFASKPVLKMFGRLVEDIAQISCVNRTFSDSFDFVQVAALLDYASKQMSFEFLVLQIGLLESFLKQH